MSSRRSRSGGTRDREDVEAVIEVLAEAALLDEVEQALVGRRDQADVDLHGFLRADRIDLALLDGAQELDLRVERQLADLVEEQRAAVGLDELADVALGRAREGALLVAEQDRLDQVLGDRAAIDGDEGLALAVARALDGARDSTSLPTPDSPSISTGMLDLAARSARRITRPMSALLVTRSRSVRVPEARRRMRRISSSSALDPERVLDRDLQALGADRLDDEVDARRRASR